ncbi:hypothetical protein MGYG_04487 [Nannizzia gypsea CBS 118893]|uniref:Uncharacterized protein n=1 Tax=Arthroderma gypseum (strain ATCC MYA-4604 / CBS 118893) TaxID=535722 RepID=E4UT83_ARTGP|nr:hypothetical protein MGYG_04487 [Nannizzia gypsea CBS 118893]EFR01479.1 hypothetical protein MGYG_04487 [Nannizzia gypsea CBS 118893]
MPESENVDDVDIDQMWKETEIEFQNLSGNSTKGLKQLTVEDVLANLKQKKESDAKTMARYARVQNAVDKTLVCIQTLGSFAALVASNFFGPANLCFSAVSMLITASQKYSKIFDGLSELFERISTFLDRFQIYARAKVVGVKLDPHLRRIIHDLLRSFVRICALSIKISKHSKVLLALEVFSFGSDKGVSAELSKLETLVQNETKMSIALILESAKISEGKIAAGFSNVKSSLETVDTKLDTLDGHMDNVSTLLEKHDLAERRRDQEGLSKQRRDKIKAALKIDKEVWRTYQEDYVGNIVPGTGQWLLNDPQFSAWADPNTKSPPIFGLKAKEGYGKSYLSSAAIRHLYRLYPPGNQDARMSVAYYFFGGTTFNSTEKSVNIALRSIIWQLTQNDAVYQKNVASACDKPEEFGDSLELWKQLVVNFSPKTNAVFYIVLDGIEELDSEIGKPLVEVFRDISAMANEKSMMTVRLFITGRPTIFSEAETASGVSLSTIELGIRNKEDIEKFIEMRMDNMEILKNKEKPEIMELRDLVKTGLGKGTQGDYFQLNYLLAEISKKRRKKEIQEVLEHAGEDREATIAREIDRLNHTLGYEDIQDLVAILSWTMGAKRAPFLKTLEGVLLIKNGEASLMPLEEQVRTKYSALLEIAEYNSVILRSKAIREFFNKQTKQETKDAIANTELHPAEVAIVRRFLNSVCDKELFDKFGFEEFFKSKLGSKSASIRVNMETLKVHVILVGMKSVANERDEEMQALRNAHFYSFQECLEEVDLALTQPEPKTEIGSYLIKHFTDETYMRKWWIADRMFQRSWWSYEDKHVNTMLKWFKDSAVTRNLSAEMKEWVNGLISNINPNDDLLSHTAKYLAKQWLQTVNWESRYLFWWLLGYVTKIKARKGEGKRVTSDVSPTLEQIYDVENWAKSELNIDTADTLWEVQMGITLHNFGFYKESIERCIKSRGLDASNWRASYIQAESCWEMDDTNTSLELIMPVMERFRNEEALRVEYEEKFYLGVLASYGVWNTEIKEYDKATTAFQEIHEHDMDQYAPIYWTLELLEQQEKYTAIIETLQDLKGKQNKEGRNRLTAMHHQYANKDEYFTRLNTAGFHSSSIDVVRDSMYEALAPENVVGVIPYVTSWLNYFLAKLLYHYPRTDADKAEAIKIWAHIVNKSARKIYLVSEADVLEATTEKLGEVYLHQAIDAGVDTPAAEEYLKKLIDLRPGAKDETSFFTCQNLQFAIARLQYLMGQKAKAMDTLRGHVKVALDLLCDDDDSNDSDAFLRLTSMTYVGDDVNALAAWTALRPSVHTETAEENEADKKEESSAEENTVNDDCKEKTDTDVKEETTTPANEDAEDVKSAEVTEVEIEKINVTVVAEIAEIKVTEVEVENDASEEGKEPTDGDEAQEQENQGEAENDDDDDDDETLPGPLELFCDGGCGRQWTYASEFYACSDCLDVQFCADCHSQLKNDGKDLKVCGRNHAFVFVPPYDPETAKQVPNGSVRVGDEIIPVSEWVKRLRVQWGIVEEEAEQEKPEEEAST